MSSVSNSSVRTVGRTQLQAVGPPGMVKKGARISGCPSTFFISPVTSTAPGTKESLAKSIERVNEQMPDYQALSTRGGAGGNSEGGQQDR